jgi:CheY-like chemotaxis protein
MDQRIILLVEDNPDDEMLTVRSLRRAGIGNAIVVARDGAEALTMLLGPDRLDPQVVLLDLKLPKIDGLEVLRQVRQDPGRAGLPVVILTSSAEEQDIVRGYDLGANSYVQKPVDFAQFAEAVRQLGCYWLLLNKGPSPCGGR